VKLYFETQTPQLPVIRHGGQILNKSHGDLFRICSSTGMIASFKLCWHQGKIPGCRPE
jgi:hypothetical protein